MIIKKDFLHEDCLSSTNTRPELKLSDSNSN